MIGKDHFADGVWGMIRAGPRSRATRRRLEKYSGFAERIVNR